MKISEVKEILAGEPDPYQVAELAADERSGVQKLQRSKFGANAQPFYVLIDNEGKPLNKSYSYDEDIDKYVDFLQTGLQNYKK